MSGDVEPSDDRRVGDRLRALALGADERRLRATWRVLLPWPVLWFLAGSVGVAVATAAVPAGTAGPARMLAFGLSQAAFFGIAWIGWARYVDRRPLASYGLSLGRTWLGEFVVAFGAVLVGYAAWLALGSALGWTSVEVVAPDPDPSVVAGLLAVFVAVGVNVWVQETVFFGVTLQNAAEGLSSRGVGPGRAVVAAWAVSVLLFVAQHRPPTAERALNLVLALGIFGLLYVHTGRLALSIGVHAAVNYAGNALVVSGTGGPAGPGVLRVTESLTGPLGALSSGAIPQLAVAYLLLVGGLAWRRGAVPVETGLARWIGR